MAGRAPQPASFPDDNRVEFCRGAISTMLFARNGPVVTPSREIFVCWTSAPRRTFCRGPGTMNPMPEPAAKNRGTGLGQHLLPVPR